MSNSFEIEKLKGSHTCTTTFIQKNHQLNVKFFANIISTLMMNNLSMMVANIQDKIKLNYK